MTISGLTGNYATLCRKRIGLCLCKDCQPSRPKRVANSWFIRLRDGANEQLEKFKDSYSPNQQKSINTM